METYKLDRIEEGFAVLECPFGKMISVKAKKLPEEAKSGDCFVLEDEGFVFSKEETEKRRSETAALLDSLVKK